MSAKALAKMCALFVRQVLPASARAVPPSHSVSVAPATNQDAAQHQNAKRLCEMQSGSAKERRYQGVPQAHRNIGSHGYYDRKERGKLVEFGL